MSEGDSEPLPPVLPPRKRTPSLKAQEEDEPVPQPPKRLRKQSAKHRKEASQAIPDSQPPAEPSQNEDLPDYLFPDPAETRKERIPINCASCREQNLVAQAELDSYKCHWCGEKLLEDVEQPALNQPPPKNAIETLTHALTQLANRVEQIAAQSSQIENKLNSGNGGEPTQYPFRGAPAPTLRPNLRGTGIIQPNPFDAPPQPTTLAEEVQKKAFIKEVAASTNKVTCRSRSCSSVLQRTLRPSVRIFFRPFVPFFFICSLPNKQSNGRRT
jgi:hypothetical protein